MKSEIDDKLTERERAVLQMYRNSGTADLARQVRLSVQYAIGAGIFVALAISLNEPLFVIAVYVVFILWMLVRLHAARALAGVMPRIIEVYESQIMELKGELAGGQGSAPSASE